jgi:hypothetical protein
MSDSVQSPISELQVSGHTMALDPGIYCVFSSPGSTPPAPDTGLPTVRISPAPGPAAGQVEVTALDSQGWIGPETATLLRISGARSNVLVTVYQAKDSRVEAPQLQVVRVSGPADAIAAPSQAPSQAALPAPAQAPAVPGTQPVPRAPREVTVVAHIYSRGDVGGNIGEWVGEPGSKRWIEGFGLAPVGVVAIEDIEYQAVLGRGWLSPWSPGGQFCGSRSMSLPILGLRVRLRGEAAKTHRIVLEATFIDGSKVGPVGAGDPCEAESLAALEAFRVAIEPLAAQVPAGKVAGASSAKGSKAAPKAAVAASPAKPAGKTKKSAAPIPEPAPEPVAIPKAKAPRTPATKRGR